MKRIVPVIFLIVYLAIMLQHNITVIADEEQPFITVNEQLNFIGDANNQYKDLILYGQANNSHVNIFSSDLIDSKSGTVIKSSNVMFNVTADQKISNFSLTLNTDEKEKVSVSVQNISPGLYSGKIFLVSQSFSSSVPITIDTKAKLFDASIWIVFGIVVSIIIWKLYALIGLYRRYADVEDGVIYIVAAFRVYKDFFKNADLSYSSTHFHLSRVMDSLEESDIENAEKRIALADQNFAAISSPDYLKIHPGNRPASAVLNRVIAPETFEKFLNPPAVPPIGLVGPAQTYGDIAHQGTTTASTVIAMLDEQVKLKIQHIKEKESERKLLAKIRKRHGQSRDPTLVPGVLSEPLGDIEDRIHENNFSITKYLTHDITLKNMAFDIGTIFVGVVAGLGSTLQQDYIGGLREIQKIDYLILFGIGIGIDNIKQIISKYVDK